MMRATGIVAVAALIALTGHAQSQPPPVKATTAGVLIDVSVLDSKGQPVLDLTPADFELNEDGKRQQLVSITLVTGGVARPIDTAGLRPPGPGSVTAPSGVPDRAAAPENTPTVTAILFDKAVPGRDALRGACRARLRV